MCLYNFAEHKIKDMEMEEKTIFISREKNTATKKRGKRITWALEENWHSIESWSCGDSL